MPSEPAEQEKYSLDEMLDRLQSKADASPEDQGELVTRADGTQAIKVRKRKRRSKQPVKEAAKKASRLKAFQVSSAVILLILIALTFGGMIIYANSSPYRKSIVSKFSTGTGANVEFLLLQVSPTATNAAGMNLQWPEGSALKSLKLAGIRAQALMGGAIGNRWSVNEVSVGSGELVIGIPEDGKPARYFPAATGESPISVERLAIADLNATFGYSTVPALQILKTEASFYPENAQGQPSLRLFRGQLKMPDWPIFRVDRALIDFHEKDVEIINLRLSHELDNEGNIELTGKIHPTEVDQEQHLGVKMKSFNMNGIAGPTLGYLVAGRIDSVETAAQTNRLTFTPDKAASRLQVTFSSTPSSLPKLNNFSFLGKLAQITENPWFLDPQFREGSSGILHRENGAVRISDLSIISKAQLQVTGDLTLDKNEMISGTLNVGLPESTVTGGRNPLLPEIFKESRDGFRWITLKISGPGSRPVDNFDDVLKAARNSPGAPDQSKDLFEQLSTPTGK